MLDLKPLNRLLFIDIETTSQKENFSDLSEHKQKLFKSRFKKDISIEVDRKIASYKIFDWLSNENAPVAEGAVKKKTQKKKIPAYSTPEELIEKVTTDVCQEVYNLKACIFAEWLRVLCVVCGVLWKKNPTDDFYNINIISFYNEDENKLLQDFVNHPNLEQIFNNVPGKYEKNKENFWTMVGHNAMVFDIPILSKKMIINGIKPPKMFDISHLKPWELSDVLIDTKVAWGFNVFDSSVSLDLLCDIFNVPSSKDDIDGSEVKDVFYKEKDLLKIVKYCEKDVVALARVYLKMKSMTEEVRVFEPQQ